MTGTVQANKAAARFGEHLTPENSAKLYTRFLASKMYIAGMPLHDLRFSTHVPVTGQNPCRRAVTTRSIVFSVPSSCPETDE